MYKHNRLLKPIKKRYTKEEVEQVIRDNYGERTYVCLQLDASQQQLDRYIREYPEIKDVMQQARESMVDLAEKKLIDLLKSDDQRVVTDITKFILKQQGRHRGWGNEGMPSLQINIQDKTKQIQAIFGVNQDEQDEDITDAETVDD